MKRITKLAIAGTALCLGLTAVAQSVQTRSPRGELVYQLVMKWGPYVSEAYRTDPRTWATQMGPAFAKADLATLERSLSQRTFKAMNDSLLGIKSTTTSQAASMVSPQVLGDPDKDLVFVPISPCRIFDTRAAVGIIAAGTTRHIDVTAIGSYAGQGGSASDCGGAGAAGSFAAVAINFTSVAPASTGYFTAFPYATTQPLAATQVFNAGTILSNYAVVRLDQSSAVPEMSIFAEKDLHLVGDMVGYYIEATKPAAALECVDTALTIVNVAAGGTANSVAPACAAGYTQTTTNCESSSWDMPMVLLNGGVCSAKNLGAGAASLRAGRTCCRVPAL